MTHHPAPSPDRDARRSRPRLRARETALVLATAGALLLTACTGDAGAGEAGSTPAEGGTLRLDAPEDTGANPCIDPFQTWGSEWVLLGSNIAERLVDQDPETGEVVPWLAAEWSVSEDGRSYTFELHDDVAFSDGEPFDAEAVKLAYETDMAVVEENPAILGAEDIEGLESITVEDEHTVTLNLDEPDSSFLSRLAGNRMGILSPASYALSTEERCRVGISSTAAFEVTEFTPYESLTLTAREDYTPTSGLASHDGGAHLDAVEVTWVSEDNVRIGNLQSDASDIAWKTNPFTANDRGQLETAGFDVEQRSVPGTAYIYWANADPGRPLSEPEVRTALQHAIDRETYAEVMYGEDYPVAQGPYDRDTALTGATDPDRLAYDPERAAELLDEAGWELGEDGYRSRDGEELALVALSYGSNPAGEELLQSQLRDVGIDLQLRQVTAAERSSLEDAGEFDLAYGYGRGSDPTSLFRFFDTQGSGGARGMSDEVFAQVADLMDENRASDDPEVRRDTADRLQDLLLEQGAVFPLFDRTQQAALNDRVGGFAFTADSAVMFHDLWLED